ncbi:hypothetical protein K8R62_02565 [bacterium]|nr:hypothetical protein [bacterium]
MKFKIIISTIILLLGGCTTSTLHTNQVDKNMSDNFSNYNHNFINEQNIGFLYKINKSNVTGEKCKQSIYINKMGSDSKITIKTPVTCGAYLKIKKITLTENKKISIDVVEKGEAKKCGVHCDEIIVIEKGLMKSVTDNDIIFNKSKEFNHRLYYEQVDFKTNKIFLNVSSSNDCVVFEYNVLKTHCDYENDVLKIEGNNIEIIEGEYIVPSCSFNKQNYGKKGKICGLKNGQYNFKVNYNNSYNNLIKTVTIAN